MLNHLTTVRPNIPLNEYLPDFAEEFLKYLEVLHSISIQRDQDEISNIMTGVKALIQRNDKNSLWTHWEKAHFLEYDSTLYEFIGVGLFLCALSKDATALQNIDTTCLKASRLLGLKI
jgi:hypothetical protein